MRMSQHPILGQVARGEPVTIEVDGQPIRAYSGEPLAIALLGEGLTAFRHTTKLDQPRSVYCGEGTCGECRVHVDGRLNERACITAVVAGMKVTRPSGELDLAREGHL